MTTTLNQTERSDDNLMAIVAELGPKFAERAAGHDVEGSFVAENFQEMRERKLFSAAIPVELGAAGHLMPGCVRSCVNWPTMTGPRLCHSPCTPMFWPPCATGSGTT